MYALAAVTDIEARLGRVFVDDELGRVVALLDDASSLVRDEAGKDWIDPDTGELTTVPGSIRAVVLRVVERAIRNPQGFSAEAAGDYSYQRTGVEAGIYLDERDARTIRKALGRTGLWTQPVTRGDDYLATVWAEDQFGCELFPLDVYRQ
jgi:Phage protein Gp19/Gp15/Gp42